MERFEKSLTIHQTEYLKVNTLQYFEVIHHPLGEYKSTDQHYQPV